MPRCNRTKAITKVYHVIIRGINKQDIFLEKEDFFKFIQEIKNTKEKYKYQIYAYSFMNDHVHFVIYDENENMSTAIQSLNVRYSSYYNRKYERYGHLFENRYKSKTVESEGYLKTLVRYIHKNPENAGLKPYVWTSYYEYLNKPNLINPDPVLKTFEYDKKQALENFKIFHMNYYKYQDFNKDFELKNKITDEEAINIIKNILNEDIPLKIQKYNKKEKYDSIKQILQIEGIRKEQISRITGVSRRTISNIEKKTSQKGQISQKETSLLGN